ncbi:MAG TPA: LLM class flavin-dependent oxidoreductase [Dehalococcoidia bacterium]|nr:LLM class flavin-dependent oxidoreductase [Dehalococcoidia bacterium]
MKFWTGAGGLSKSRVFPSSLPARYPSVVEEAKLADELGFDAITCPEHHMMYDGFVTTPLQVLAAAAAVTTNIKFIPGAMLQPLYDPLEAAEYAATLDVISNGRAMMGLGVGYRPYEFDAFGYAKKTRGARTTEAIQAIRLATSQKKFSFEGKHYHYEDASIYPQPVQNPIPTWYLGGTSEIAARRAGRNGFPYWLANSSFERTEVMVNEYRKAGHEAGFTDDQLMVACHKDVCIGQTMKEAEELKELRLDNYDEHILGYGYLVDEDGQHIYGAGRDHPIYRRFMSSIFCGTLDLVIEELKRYEALGVHAVTASGNKKFWAENILPEFRED